MCLFINVLNVAPNGVIDMKLEIEISEDEIRDSVTGLISAVIMERANSWTSREDIRRIVEKHWGSTVEVIVQEELKKSDDIRDQIKEVMERKLKAQLTTLLKKADT